MGRIDLAKGASCEASAESPCRRAHRGDHLATSPPCRIWMPFAVGSDLGCRRAYRGVQATLASEDLCDRRFRQAFDKPVGDAGSFTVAGELKERLFFLL